MSQSSKGKVVAEGVLEKGNDQQLDVENIRILGGDRTNSNTGYEDGSLSWIEELAKKPFHWFICNFHLLELPLRKLTKSLVGETSGPGTYKSEFGQKLQGMAYVPEPVSFTRIICDDFPTIEGNNETNLTSICCIETFHLPSCR